MEKSDKRVDIVKAALELIAENGFHGAPMALIARQAGVGTGTIYIYFANKDVLITEVYQYIKERMYPVIMEGYASEKPIRKRFLQLGTALLRYFIENPLYFRYMEQFQNSPYGAERRDKILRKKESGNVFLELFDVGVSQQVIKDLPLVILIDLLFGPILAVARDHILGLVVLDDALIAKTIKACWDGIKR
jgi:AcrR family transcriptional regulator